MKAAVVRFPGTNNEYETVRALESFGIDAEIIDHHETNNSAKVDSYDGYWFAGGFSYGDVLRAGAIASASEIVNEIKSKGKPIIGVCNGFQILTETRLLQGALLPNTITRFICDWITIKIPESANSFVEHIRGEVLKIPIAHFEGNFYHEAPETLTANIIAQYSDKDGNITEDANPNGSLLNIAGLTSDNNQILGLMPHPERASFKFQGSTDGRKIIEGFIDAMKK